MRPPVPGGMMAIAGFEKMGNARRAEPHRDPKACSRSRAAMLGSAGRHALLVACLPVLLLGDPSSPGAARAADVTISTTTTGARGGDGADNTNGQGGPGGAGSTGYQYGQTGTVTVNQTITGGAGGTGGYSMSQPGTTGGKGGAGLEVTLRGTAAINAAVSGGAGGASGTVVFDDYFGIGGAGGAGLVFADGGTATIDAAVRGGGGGLGIVSGLGGAGIIGGGLTLRLGANANVAGGLTASSTNRASALVFTGGSNILSLQTGAILTGGISLNTNTTTLQFDQANNYTLPNVIAGAGSVRIAGPGSLILTGANSYTGGTVIDGGSLWIGDQGTSGSITGNVVNNSILGFGRSNDITFDGAISGTGSVVKNGAGTLTLLGTSIYTGGTAINAGTLRVGGGSTSGSITGDVVNNATLAFDRSDATSFAGGISGTGAVAKNGAGTLTLTGTNSYTGGTTINGGVLRIGNGGTTGSIAGNVVNNGTLAFVRSDATSFAGTISGTGGVGKGGVGTLTLTGTSTYTGATTIDGGTLSVNGSIASSSVTVSTGGTLGGTGTVGATTIAGGTLAPGNSIGTLAVAGNLSFSAGSTYAVEVSPSASDRVNVTGTATLGGATVAASFAAGTYVAKQYTILNATGGVSGTFGTKADTNLPAGFKSSLGYDANNAYLTLALDFTPASMPTPTPVAPKSPVPNSGLNPNQTAAANALTNFFDRTGGIPVVFGSLTPAGLSQVAGEPATGTPQTSVNAMGQFMATLADVSPEGRGVSIAPGPTGFAAYSSSNGKGMDLPAKQLPAAADPDAWRWSVWAGGFGTAQFVGADAGAGTAASTNRIYGAIAGADYRISRDTIAGFALGGGATSFNTYGLGSGSSDLFQAGAFIRQRFGASYVSAALGYAWQDVTTDRSVTGADHLQARFNANTWSGRVEAGHRFGLTAFGITPYAAGQITTVALPGYTETALSGASTFALSYAARETTRTRSELGLRADAELAIAHLPLKLQGGLSWIHNYDIGNSTIATFQALPGATFSVGGAALDRNALRTTASAELSLSKGLALAALFEGEFARNSRSFGGKGALRYSW